MGSQQYEPSPFNQPNRDGYTPVNMVQKNGQYYNYTPPAMGNPVTLMPRMAAGKINPEAGPQGTYTPVNFGGGGQQSGGRYGAPRKYGTPSSSYRTPATYSNTPAPSYSGGMSAPSHRGGIIYSSPSFAPRNYASTMDMPSVADTPENRVAGQQYNDQLNQRFSSKGGVSPTPPRSSQLGNLYKPNKSGAGAALGRVPSFDPNNPQEDAIKDPKLKKAAKQLNKQAPPGERLAFINPQEESVLKALGGSGMTAAGGIPSYKKGDVEAPPPRDYGKETADTLQAQVDLAPELYAKEAEFRPQYANLERGIMLEQMGIDPNMGLLDAFRTISGAQKDIQRDSTLADINMIGGLGQQFAEAVRSADPEAEALRQSIMADASAGLEEGAGEFSEIADQAREDYLSGEGLTALEKRDIDQQILEGAASRGMEGQASTLQDQVAGRLSADRSVRDQRRDVFERALANESTAQQQSLQNAGTAYSMGNFDPLLALTGRSGTAPAMAQQGFGGANFALNSSPAIFNPESAYAGSLATSNQQNIMDARTATAANRAGMMQGLMGMGGSIVGGMASGGTGFFKG